MLIVVNTEKTLSTHVKTMGKNHHFDKKYDVDRNKNVYQNCTTLTKKRGLSTYLSTARFCLWWAAAAAAAHIGSMSASSIIRFSTKIKNTCSVDALPRRRRFIHNAVRCAVMRTYYVRRRKHVLSTHVKITYIIYTV